ncbi:hypothetical protein LTR27_008671 [Elasticomyces elasticus]|nr:hypothetical protein LTR27_008671 [Elasticomyces elasticus]
MACSTDRQGSSDPPDNALVEHYTTQLTDDSVARPVTIYRKLRDSEKEIRLLLLKAGFQDEPVICELRHICLTVRPLIDYKTISYVWGDANIRGKIRVEGHWIDVPASSEAVLRRMRRRDRDILVWIDAVSINQRDAEERDRQVALMAEIYGNTAKNLIWLGDPVAPYTAEDAMAAMMTVWEHALAKTQNGMRFRQSVLDPERSGYRRAPRDDKLPDFDHKALLQLYASAWFKRLWVVQEAGLALSSDCCFGDKMFPLDMVLRVALWLHKYRWNIRFDFAAETGLVNATRIWLYVDREQGPNFNQGRRYGPLGQCLDDLATFEAHEPRDHVYAVLGLHLYLKTKVIGSQIPLLLMPEYRRSLPDILRDATIHSICEDRNLFGFRNLGHVLNDTDLNDSTPSWVHRWDRPRDNDRHATQLRGTFRCCAEHSRISIHERLASGDWQDRNILSAEGIMIDKVCQAWNVLKQATKAAAIVDIVLSVQDALLNLGCNQEQSLEMLAFTLAASTDSRGRPLCRDRAVGGFKTWLAYLRRRNRRPPSRVIQHTRGLRSKRLNAITNYDIAISNAWLGRKIFVTACGRLGIGPATMQTESVVIVLWGCRWPVVLRPVDGTTDHAIFGAAYLHGVMDGEAVVKHEDTGVQQQVFRLR